MDNQQEMTPLEAVTHLFVCLILADGRMDFEEREAWADAITELFPNHTEGRAVDFMQDASRTILMMDSFGRRNYAVGLCSMIKAYFSHDDLQNLSLIHIRRCRRYPLSMPRSPPFLYHNNICCFRHKLSPNNHT